MFKQYDCLVLSPFVHAITENMGIAANENDAYLCTLITKDGSMTQLDTTVDEDNFQALTSLNATFVKLAKNISSGCQPCNAGGIHMRQRGLMDTFIK